MTSTVGETIAAPLRVLVVDDHQTFADLLSLALSSEPDLQCVGTAGSAAEAVAMALDLKPDLVVMDIEMPRQDGLAATRRLREVLPELIIIVVTAHRDPQWVLRATQAGRRRSSRRTGRCPRCSTCCGGPATAACSWPRRRSAPPVRHPSGPCPRRGSSSPSASATCCTA